MRLHIGVDRGEPRCVVELVNHVAVRVGGEPGVVTELPRDIQPTARHTASTASLAFVPHRQPGCEETSVAGELAASYLSTASREIRGERPT